MKANSTTKEEILKLIDPHMSKTENYLIIVNKGYESDYVNEVLKEYFTEKIIADEINPSETSKNNREFWGILLLIASGIKFYRFSSVGDYFYLYSAIISLILALFLIFDFPILTSNDKGSKPVDISRLY